MCAGWHWMGVLAGGNPKVDAFWCLQCGLGVSGVGSTGVRRRVEPGPGGAAVTDGAVAPAAMPGGLSPASPPRRNVREPDRRSAAVEAGVEEFRRWYGSDVTFLFPRLEDRLRRRLGLAPLSAGAEVLAGLTGVGIRLSAALLVTALAGQWAGIPWGRWAVILAFFGLTDARQPRTTPPLDVEPKPQNKRTVEGWTALLPTLARESDVHEVVAFARRWYRLPVAVTTGVTVAAAMLLGCWRVAPTGITELHPGSLLLLAFLLYEFGWLVYGALFWWALVRRQASCEHRLFWVSPADSPEIRTAREKMPGQSFAFGLVMTVYLVLAVALTSWDSPLVLPLGVGFLVIGYLTIIGSALGDRAAIRRIVERSRDHQLDRLQQQLELFESRYTHLTPQQSDQLARLVELHSVIRDAPTTGHPRTLWRSAAGLLIPTLVFALTVLAEVLAERFLDTILP